MSTPAASKVRFFDRERESTSKISECWHLDNLSILGAGYKKRSKYLVSLARNIVSVLKLLPFSGSCSDLEIEQVS
jgi:hypothetical protein